MNAEAKCVPHDLACLTHNLNDMNHERAHLLLWGQLEFITDQLDGNT
jgi:hypothetical protein